MAGRTSRTDLSKAVHNHVDKATSTGYRRPMEWEDEIDAIGLLCPLPVLKAQKRLGRLQPGARLRLLASDPASWVDVPHFCATAGHVLLSAEEADGIKIYLIERGRT
jgi:tRNA 2-thiouridine synthesizing protein A